MKTRNLAYPLVFILLTLFAVSVLFASGCRRPPAAPMEAEVSLGVAGFSQPRTDYEALAHYIPSGSDVVPPRVLAQMDALLTDKLSAGPRRFFGPDKVRTCLHPDGQTAISRHAALDYWIKVGECLQVDYLLVPQLLFYRERDGSAAGSTAPASVMLDMYVLDIKGYGVAARYRFDETQVSLTDNMLTLPKFVARGGKWVTAVELAEWGITEGLESLGLK